MEEFKDEKTDALRDLSVSLNNVGQTAQALGHWEQAQQAFDEGLQIGRVLAAAIPKHRDYNALARHFEVRLQALHQARTESS